MIPSYRVLITCVLVLALCSGCGWIVGKRKKEREEKSAKAEESKQEVKAEKSEAAAVVAQRLMLQQLENELNQSLSENKRMEEELRLLRKRLEDEKGEHAETRRQMLMLSKRVADYEKEPPPRPAPPRPARKPRPQTELPPDAKAASQKLLTLGRKLYDKNDYEGARSILDALTQLGYRDGYVYFMLGRSCAELGDIDLAIEYYNHACDLYELADETPKYYLYALNNLGALLREKQRYAEAAVAYERARYVDPNYTTVYYNLGVLYEEFLNDKAKAIECYQKYIDLKGERIMDAEERVHELRQELLREKEKNQ